MCLAVPSFGGVAHSWRGTVNDKWSEAGNWSPATVPAPADAITFPAASPKTVTFDLPAGTAVGQMLILGAYTIGGNAMTFTNLVTVDLSGVTFDVPITIGALEVRVEGPILFNADVNVNGKTLTLGGETQTFAGTLSGTGTIAARNSSARFPGGGTFSGLITDGFFEVTGDLSSASVQGSLAGDGSVGDVTITHNSSPQLTPGRATGACCWSSTAVGTLHTHALSLVYGSFIVDLAGGAASDQVQVTGSVSLGGELALFLAGGANAPAIGESFTIIDNDGSDPVNGTFAGYPEGAQVMCGQRAFRITYRGGDGNDVVLTASEPYPSTRTWTGSRSDEWSDAKNWAPAAVPVDGEPLIFPADATVTNIALPFDRSLRVGALTFGATYSVAGRSSYNWPYTLTLEGNVTVAPGAFAFLSESKLGAPIALSGSVAFRALDVNGQALTTSAAAVDLGLVSGSGSIAAQGSTVSFDRGSTFSGPVTGGAYVVEDVDMPNASFTGALSGSGTVGAVQIVAVNGVAAQLTVGGEHSGATLQTKSLAITNLDFDIDALDFRSDHLRVTGSVSVAGELRVSLIGYPVPAGAKVVVIDNDGTDPISGTFDGLPEAATIVVDGRTMYLSYRGGDGNDLTLEMALNPGKKTWLGTVNGLWSEPGNWSPAVVPAAGESLLFPANGAHLSMTNDLPAGRTYAALDFRASYTLSGNAIALAGDLSLLDYASEFTCNADLALAGAAHLSAASTKTVWNGAIDTGAYTLTIEPYNATVAGALRGSGTIVVGGETTPLAISSSGTFSGTIRGVVELDGALPNAQFEGGLSGNGTAGAVTIAGASRLLSPGALNACCGDAKMIGLLSTGPLSLATTMMVDLRSATSDAVQVTGSVTLGGTLAVFVTGTAPVPGQQFAIVRNDGTDAVQGTFAGLGEGALILAPPSSLRISYHGGDGNDVVLTVLGNTTTSLASSAAATRPGEPVTFTASVSANGSTPEGTVAFSVDGTVMKNVQLAGGAAAFTYAPTEPGTHNVEAAYGGTTAFGPSTAAVVHEVLRGSTTTSLAMQNATLAYGDPISISIAVQAIAPATGTAGGAVTVRASNVSIGNAALSSGEATLRLRALDAGSYDLVASYAGDTRFEPSVSAAATLTVLKARTITTAALSGGTLAISVSAENLPPVPPAGVVTISENDSVLARTTIVGSDTIALPALTSGAHQLVVAFGGSNNFEPSSTNVTVTITQPELSVRDLTVSEGDSGTKSAAVRVELSAPASESVTVTYTTRDGSAAHGSDFDAASGTLTFAPGQTNAQIAVTIRGDAIIEGDETFSIDLSAPAGAALRRASGTVTILNDDLAYRAILDLAYSTAPPLTLDLYVPSEGSGPFPLIVWIPGTTSYDPSDRATPALRETSRGYAVAVARYRTPAAARFPAQLDDLRTAIRWLRGNGAQWKLETTRLVVWGSSAGAHLAALLGTTNGATKSAGVITADVQGVIAFGAASDLLALQSDAASAGCATDFNAASSPQSTLIGCAITTCTDRASDASPITHIDRADAPFLLVHGANDCVVPAAQSTRLYAALRAAGVSATIQTLAAAAPSTWNAADTAAKVDAFLDTQSAEPGGKRRSVRK
ncbi:MAG TPA: Ig-like domain repeat protein [Thermoanaerobaculia bacterium]